MVSFDVTTKCNMNCSHCRTVHIEEDLSTSDIFLIIDKLSKLKPKFIALTGGEPFMRKDLSQIIKKIKEYDICVQVNTNALLIEENSFKEMAHDIDFIQISLDGIGEVHESYRGRGSFKQTLEQINMISKYSKVIINTVVSKVNLDLLDEMAEYLFDDKKINCYLWGLKRIIPTNEFGKKNFLQKEDLYKLAIKCEELALKYKGRLQVKTDIPQKNTFQKKRVEGLMEKYELSTAGCAAINTSLTIKANGDVSPCTIIPLSVGNLLEQEIEDIYNTETVKSLSERKGFEGKCGNCENIMICGGCRATAYALTGNILGEDGACFVWKK